MDSSEKTRLTFYYEKWRAFFTGIVETATTTFLLVIAVRWFEAGAWSKSLIASGGALGLLLSPGVVHFAQVRGWTSSKASALLSFIGSGCFVAMALFPVLPVFAFGSVLAFTSAWSATPMFTQIYQENYPRAERGRLFARTFIIRIGAAAVFAELAGRLLTGVESFGPFRILLLVFAAAFGICGYCLARCPSEKLVSDRGTHPFRSLRYARDDKLFRNILISWMVFGIGNLMTLPLRVEYLANPEYGLALEVSLIALLTAVVPNVMRLVSVRFWGWCFDHMNFFTLRVILNLGFAASIVIFFASHDLIWLLVGAVIFGLSASGGEVAWSLWVTRFAPHERVADYMSVHTFFTGIRGLLSPFAGFFLVQVIPMSAVGWISGALILAANIFLFTGTGRSERRGFGGAG